MFIDTHAHILDERFEKDRMGVIARAQQAGVLGIVEISCDPSQWDRAITLASGEPVVRCCIGLHPQDARLSSPGLLERFEELSHHDIVSGIGETGLDYYYENSPRDQQQELFLFTLDLARKTKKPVVIHCRDAYDDLLRILRTSGPVPSGVVHCFSGTPPQARELLALGLHLGIDGPLTYPRAEALRNAVREAPLERLLLETDSPYLPPQQHRGERNEPSYLPLIAAEVAALKGLTVEAVAAATTASAKSLFHWNE